MRVGDPMAGDVESAGRCVGRSHADMDPLGLGEVVRERYSPNPSSRHVRESLPLRELGQVRGTHRALVHLDIDRQSHSAEHGKKVSGPYPPTSDPGSVAVAHTERPMTKVRWQRLVRRHREIVPCILLCLQNLSTVRGESESVPLAMLFLGL
jgi:hypothetical protein